MILDLLDQLSGEWSSALENSGCRLRKPLCALKVSGKGGDRKVNFLIFEQNNQDPALLLKMSRSTAYEERLQHEYNALKEISHIDGLSESAPRPVGLFQYKQRLVLVQHYMPGTPLSVFLRRHKRIKNSEVGQDISTAMNWLLKFQEQTSSGQELPVERLIDSVHILKSAYPEFTLAPDFVGSLIEAEEFDGLHIPLVASHGDFWPGNFLVGKQGIGVIDWESFQRTETPFHDAFMFLTTYASSYPWSEWKWDDKLHSFDHSFLQRNWFSQILKEQIHRYLHALDVPPLASHLLYSMFLIHMASQARRYDRDEQQAKSWFELLKLYSENWKRSIFLS